MQLLNLLPSSLENLIRRLSGGDSSYRREDVLFSQGQLYAKLMEAGQFDISKLQDAEYKVFSQWGEDGIIEFLVQSLEGPHPSFVEIGVEDYKESNTRFLLQHRNWRGLVIDSDEQAVETIRDDRIYWRQDISAAASHVTRENVDSLMTEAGFSGEVGLLSIDIDGNDYWVWEAIEEISPQVVVIEFNSVFGNRHPITIPYDPDFRRSEAHHSHLYFGASLPALVELAQSMGYDFLGATTSGVNAFFLREDLDVGLDASTAREGYIESRLRESRDESGRLNYLSGTDRIDEIDDMPVYHVSEESTYTIGELRPLID